MTVDASPTVTDLGNPGSLLVNPESISLLEQGGNWYGVVGAVDIGGILTRLDFGSDITSTPTGTDLGSFGYTGRPRYARYYYLNGSFYLIFSHYNTTELVVVDYGNSLDNPIDNGTDVYTSGAIGDLTLMTGFDLVDLGGEYVIYAGSQLSSNLVRMDYGSNLLGTPTVTSYAVSGTRIFDVRIHREGSNYYGLLSSDSRGLEVYDLGDLSAGVTPGLVSYGLTLPTGEVGYVFRYSGNTYAKVINGGTNYDLTFSLDCGASIGSSALETPPVVSYNSSGDKIIDLTVIDSDGDVSFAVDTVTVTSSSAPTISLNDDGELCKDVVKGLP